MKMQHFKLQARSILGPSKKVGIKIDGLLDEEDYLDELYGDGQNSDPNVYMYKTSEGKVVMVNKEYRQSMDIVTAYKSLKQAVTKSGTVPYTASSREASIGRKGYLKMTIAAQQHSKQRMNQELLVYQLQASKIFYNLTYYRT
jgi:hypothetical protein